MPDLWLREERDHQDAPGEPAPRGWPVLAIDANSGLCLPDDEEPNDERPAAEEPDTEEPHAKKSRWDDAVELYELELELEKPLAAGALDCDPCTGLVYRIARNAKARVVRRNASGSERTVLDEKKLAIAQIGVLAPPPNRFADPEDLETVRLDEHTGGLRHLGPLRE